MTSPDSPVNIHKRMKKGLSRQGTFKISTSIDELMSRPKPRAAAEPQAKTVDQYKKEKEEEEIFNSLNKFNTINEINKSFGLNPAVFVAAATPNSTFKSSQDENIAE